MKTIIQKKIEKIKRLHHINNLLTSNPMPGLNDLDKKLEKYFDFHNGFFIELGANDGYSQSNTFYLEYIKNWRGILIEGIPELFEKCKYNRLNSEVINCACVSDDFENDYIEMKYSNLMSIVRGAFQNEKIENEHVLKGMVCQKIKTSYSVNVPARTLNSVLNEYCISSIDFLSLDVEGYECNVLKGLDLQKFKPKYICVEVWFPDQVHQVLSDQYDIVEQLTHHDYLYIRKT
jgi:FkbM family methyltransferase